MDSDDPGAVKRRLAAGAFSVEEHERRKTLRERGAARRVSPGETAPGSG